MYIEGKGGAGRVQSNSTRISCWMLTDTMKESGLKGPSKDRNSPFKQVGTKLINLHSNYSNDG